MGDRGFEIYAGSFKEICVACADELLFEKLQNGEITSNLVHFSDEVDPGDILFLDQALASMLGVLVDFDMDRVELENGYFVDCIKQAWVAAVAKISEKQVPELQRRWILKFVEVEEREPDWASIDQSLTLQRFLQICQVAQREQFDLVMVWFL